jgi:uncharacterized Rmd1/YagE family protein
VSATPAVEHVAVHAYAFASTFRLRELAAAFVPDGSVGAARSPLVAGGAAAEVVLEQDELRAGFAAGGSAICFDFGAVVFFGVDPVRREAVVREISQRVSETQPPRTEEFLVDVEPGARGEVTFDRVIVAELTWPVRQIVGLLVAQSAAMDYYEDDVQDILTRSDRITRDLAERGRLRGRVKKLVQFIGSCILTKNDVVETLALFDKPEATWEQEPLDRLYTALRKMLEIDDRFRALEYRLRVIQDNLVLLVDLSQQRRNLVLEVSIFLLILVELIVMLWQVAHARG